jgi:hypothetical protein
MLPGMLLNLCQIANALVDDDAFQVKEQLVNRSRLALRLLGTNLRLSGAPTDNSTQMSLRLPILAHSDHPTLSLAVDIAASLLGLMIHMI